MTPGPRTGERLPLSLSLPTRGGMAGADFVRLARAAEDAEFTTVFVAERVADALTVCQEILSATTDLHVGTAVLNARLRHPVLCAMTATALAESSGGRFVLGLGTANAQLNEGRLGLGAVAPRSWMAEYVAVVRQACSGRPVQFSGRYFQVDDLVLDRTAAVPVPLHLGALQEGMLRLAGTVADGVILNLRSLESLSVTRGHLAAAAAGRQPGLRALDVACVIPCCISDDVEAAREAARHALLDYVLHPAAAELFGLGTEPGLIDALQHEMRADRRMRAADLLPDELVDRFVVSGAPADCAARIHAYREAGVEMPVVFPRPVGADWASALWELAQAYRDRDLVPAGAGIPQVLEQSRSVT